MLKSVRVPRGNPISYLADLVKLVFYTGLLVLRVLDSVKPP